MKIFKEVIYSVNRFLSLFLLGNAITQAILQDYQTSTYLLFIVATLFGVGYFAEKWS